MKLAILLVNLNLGLGVVVFSQPTYLDKSIDPNGLELDILLDQLDTSNVFRLNIPLEIFSDEFDDNQLIKVESFYQKSGDHMLLNMGSIMVHLNNTFVESSGIGTTYFRISDGVCHIIFENFISSQEMEPAQEVLHRDCNQ
jgi:hypothetical protein